MRHSTKRSWTSWLSLFFLGFLWGGSFLFIKKGLMAFSPVQMGALRLSLASAAFLPMGLYYWKRTDRRHWPYIAAVGFIGSFIPLFLYAFGQTRVHSALSGVLSTMTPIFTLVIGILFFRQHATGRKLAGVLLGFAGAAWLIFSRGGQVAGDWRFALLIILATCCYAVSSNIVQAHLSGVKPLAISALSFTFIGLPSMVILYFSGFENAFARDSRQAWTSLGFIAFLALAGTFLATMIYFRLVQREGAVFATMVGYFFPLVATLLGFLDGEVIHAAHFAGMILIIAGIYVMRHQ